MNEFTKTPSAELWFEKADNYLNTVNNITERNRFGCVEYYSNAIKNTSSDAERSAMELRITQSYGKYVNQVLKSYLQNIDFSKDFDELAENTLEEVGTAFGPLLAEGICIIQENCGFYPIFLNDYQDLFTKTSLDFLKTTISKLERIKSKDPVEYFLKSWFVCKIVYYCIYLNFDMLEDFFKAIGNPIDLTKMRAGWWEVISETRNTLKKVEETAYNIQQNPHFKTAAASDIQTFENSLRKNQTAYNKVKKAEREKYFSEHPEELKKLKEDISSCENEITELHREMDVLKRQIAAKRRELNDQKAAEENEYQTQIKKAEQELSSLGLFKFSEKKLLKEKISELQKTKSGLASKYASLEVKELNGLNSQINILENKVKKYQQEINQLKTKLP